MKNGIIIAAITLMSSAVYAQSSALKQRKVSVTAEKTLLVDRGQIELGENMELTPTEFSFVVSNVGSKTIQVKRIVTTAFISPKSADGFMLLPGESKKVLMVHDPEKGGQFLETAVIESDASNTMEIIKVFGTIKEEKASLK